MARTAKHIGEDTEISVEASSGNVFADLGLDNPEELAVKAALASRISSIITHRHVTQKEAATILGVDQPKVSALMRGRLDQFSIERLLKFLNALDRDVEIVIRKKPRTERPAHLCVVTA